MTLTSGLDLSGEACFESVASLVGVFARGRDGLTALASLSEDSGVCLVGVRRCIFRAGAPTVLTMSLPVSPGSADSLNAGCKDVDRRVGGFVLNFSKCERREETGF